MKRGFFYVLLGFNLLSCSTPTGIQLPSDSSLWPAPLPFKAVKGLEPGQVSVEVLKTSETIPSPRWLAIDSKDRLYVTVGNSHDSILYAVDTANGQVSKYKSGALDMPAVTLKKIPVIPIPQITVPATPPSSSSFELNVSNKEHHQLSPTITVDGQDNVFTFIPYTTSFWGNKSGWQIHKINISDASQLSSQILAQDRQDKSLTPYSHPSGKGFFIDEDGQFVAVMTYSNNLLYLSERKLEHVDFLGASSVRYSIYPNLLTGVHKDRSGNIWVASNQNTPAYSSSGVINTTDSTFTYSSSFTTGSGGNLPENAIFIDITSDESEHLYVTESKHGTVYKIWPQEQRAEVIANSQDGLETPVGMAWDSKGNLYVADATKNQIFVIKPRGN